MPITTMEPAQVPADHSNPTSTVNSVSGGSSTVTQTVVTPKKTAAGAAGSVTVVNGKVTSHTPAS